MGNPKESVELLKLVESEWNPRNPREPQPRPPRKGNVFPRRASDPNPSIRKTFAVTKRKRWRRRGRKRRDEEEEEKEVAMCGERKAEGLPWLHMSRGVQCTTGTSAILPSTTSRTRTTDMPNANYIAEQIQRHRGTYATIPSS
eukprot:3439536-Pyramimonas_sp.AAC.1